MEPALAFAGVIIAALLGFLGSELNHRRHRAETLETKQEARAKEVTKADVDRADLIFDTYGAVIERLEAQLAAQDTKLTVVNARLDDCLNERIEWREEKLAMHRELDAVKRRLERARTGLAEDPEPDTPPPASG